MRAEDIAFERHKIAKILARMRTNGVLIVENQSLDESSAKGWLRVHPNFGGSRYVRQARVAPGQHQSGLGPDTASSSEENATVRYMRLRV